VVKALEKGLVQPMYAKVREHGAPVQWARLGGEQESEDAIGASTAPRDDKKGVSSVVVSHSSPKAGLTPISCHAELERSACAPFIKERRMECINATSLHRKSGPWGTQRSLERESCYKLQLTHPGEGAADDIGYLAVARAIDAGVGRVSQVGMIECILCLYFELHR
jgi:hypothetical protein